MNTHVALRLVLYSGETYRVDRSSAGLRVRDGAAWVTFAGRDAILGRGEELLLEKARDFAVISALGRSPLVLEVLGRERATSGALTRPRLRRGVACEGS